MTKIIRASCDHGGRVFNETRRILWKPSQAARAVKSCTCAWVEFGVSVRELTKDERLAALGPEAAKVPDGLPFAELPGVVYRPAPGNEDSARMERAIALEANEFAEAC